MGRPRSVPEKDALERALKLFWERGYDRTSISDLSRAIGVGPSSIYNAFGSKIEIYEQALALYMRTHAGFTRKIFQAGAERQAGESIRDLLREAVVLYTGKHQPQGCAMMQGGGAGGPDDSPACAITRDLRRGLERSVHDLLAVRKRRGDALANSPAVLAKYVVGSMRGLSQLARDGAGRRELLQIADHVAKSCVGSGTS